MTTTGPGIFENDAAQDFLTKLQSAPPTAVGDLVSAALRAVAQAEKPLTAADVQSALAALALLLAEFDGDVLTGATDPTAVQAWFVDLEVELTPSRRQIADATTSRILLAQDNGWADLWADSEDGRRARSTVKALRDLLADSASPE
ncbi:hypothetical protein ABIB25_001825 [Nakamurella sp. UYEF19]|uniref:DUF4259 domain-containing protein n=1 Tax=Nakamurella sp. UYEF19 TaxID=1756392 RepID=UPI00339849BF